MTITKDTDTSKVSSTVVKAKCPSLGDSWVHVTPAKMKQTLFAGVNETVAAHKASKLEDHAAHEGHKEYNEE